jgi:CxxC-x17-CxxC domain-containing protein
MADQTLTCTDCGAEFTFTESEQEFYQSKGFSTPGRCPSCRAARKAARNAGGYSGSSYGGGGGGYGGERQMYPAVCAQCGKQTEVPFQPRGDRPVYCSDCFRAQGGGGRSGGGYGGGGSGYGGGGRSSGGRSGGGRSDRDRGGRY